MNRQRVWWSSGKCWPTQTVVTPENVTTVSGIIQQNPRKSNWRIAAETGLKHSSMQKILKNSLHMFPFKIQSHQAIPIRAVWQRADFANQILTMIDNEGFDVGCIWFTDEAHFHLNGFMNKQNWRFWGSKNPHLCEAKLLHSPKVTVSTVVSSRGIICPFSCEKWSLVDVMLQFWNNLSPYS